jgi:hypothetical protein
MDLEDTVHILTNQRTFGKIEKPIKKSDNDKKGASMYVKDYLNIAPSYVNLNSLVKSINVAKTARNKSGKEKL